MPNAVLIGAGVGDLSTGALLASHGHRPKILEKHNQLGGRTAYMKFQEYMGSSLWEILQSAMG